MFKKLLTHLEKRRPTETVTDKFPELFASSAAGSPTFSEKGFEALLDFLENGESSFQGVAVQAGVKWSVPTQRVTLRNAIQSRGFVTASCLWAYRQLRGRAEELLKPHQSPETGFMQIALLKEADPAIAVPFLIENFLEHADTSEELRAASRLCILRLLDSAGSERLLASLRKRYPRSEILLQWRPAIPLTEHRFTTAQHRGPVDFHELVRSVHDIKELSSLTRTVYLLSQFYVPLTEKQWRALLLSRTDEHFFRRLMNAGIVQSANGGFLVSGEEAKQAVIRKFLFDSYSLAKQSIHRHKAARVKEERERRVRNTELDRQALEMVPDGIICVDKTGLFFYLNPAAERLLNDSPELKRTLFGDQPLEDALKGKSPETTLNRIGSELAADNSGGEVFGDRIALFRGGKRFEVEIRDQIILLRDTTDRHLVDEEIGRLYRHEMKAALDVMGVGLETAQRLVSEGKTDEGIEFLQQVEQKRVDLFAMLEERIDFIRLHSDSFRVKREPVNLNMIVDRTVSNYFESAAAKNVEIKSNHLHTDATVVKGEERFLIRALDNIVRNAVRFSESASTIEITLSRQGRNAMVAVRDEGVGIPKENLGKIFRLGFTTGGTGRGLYLARRIVHAHGGSIEVTSKQGHGSRFTLRFPLLNGEA